MPTVMYWGFSVLSILLHRYSLIKCAFGYQMGVLLHLFGEMQRNINMRLPTHTSFSPRRITGVIGRWALLFLLGLLSSIPSHVPAVSPQNLVRFGCSELQLSSSSLCLPPDHRFRGLLKSVWVSFQMVGMLVGYTLSKNVHTRSFQSGMSSG